MNKIVDCKIIKDKLLENYKNIVSKSGNKYKLVVITIGENPASDVYVTNKKKACDYVGIDFENIRFSNEDESEIINTITKLNNDDSVTGILLQLPLPFGYDEDKIINSINYKKDVDGLTDTNVGLLQNSKECLCPCTPLGILEILKSINASINKSNIVIVGRSRLVGKPLSTLLLNNDATVTICHSKTTNLKDITKMADILIVAIGNKHYIDDSYIKDDAIVIDVGINREDNKLYGDCNTEKMYDKCKYITPVPGGVGQLTVAMLINNVIKAKDIQ